MFGCFDVTSCLFLWCSGALCSIAAFRFMAFMAFMAKRHPGGAGILSPVKKSHYESVAVSDLVDRIALGICRSDEKNEKALKTSLLRYFRFSVSLRNDRITPFKIL